MSIVFYLFSKYKQLAFVHKSFKVKSKINHFYLYFILAFGLHIHYSIDPLQVMSFLEGQSYGYSEVIYVPGKDVDKVVINYEKNNIDDKFKLVVSWNI